MNDRDNIVQLREIAEWIRGIDTGNDHYNYKLLKVQAVIEDIIIDMVYDKLDNEGE